jgi:hypothetical protein
MVGAVENELVSALRNVISQGEAKRKAKTTGEKMNDRFWVNPRLRIADGHRLML